MAIGALSRDSSRLRNSASASNSPRSPQNRIDAALPQLHDPTRMCRVCRKRLPKAQLSRWVRQEGAVTPDTAQILSGRGYYTCSDTCAAKLPRMIKHIKP